MRLSQNIAWDKGVEDMFSVDFATTNRHDLPCEILTYTVISTKVIIIDQIGQVWTLQIMTILYCTVNR